LEFKEGLTFDDVLLVPKYSDITSRSQTDLSTKLSRNISINIPFVSANMDTVTESSMAMAMARAGGIGIIHRFLPIKEQASEVLKVKRSGSVIIENPYSISPEKSIQNALDYAEDKEISGLLVADSDSKLIGIITDRDLLFADPTDSIHDVMTKDVITAKPGVTIDEAKEILHKHRLEKLPIIDDSGIIKGLITSKDITNNADYPNASKDKKGRPLVGAAVGVKGDFLERSESLLEAGADILVVDIAHGHSENALSTVRNIKKAFPDCELIAGNVATAQGADDLIKAGVDAVKVGVGSGSICITRVITGSGVPQLTAVMDCAKIGNDSGVPIISDGTCDFFAIFKLSLRSFFVVVIEFPITVLESYAHKIRDGINSEITSCIFLSYFNPEMSLIISIPCTKTSLATLALHVSTEIGRLVTFWIILIALRILFDSTFSEIVVDK